MGTFFPVLLAGPFLLPPPAAALAAVPGALLARVEQRPRWLRRIWRAAQLALAVWAASWAHRAPTGVDAEVAVVVERQADPYREQPVGAQVVRAVNAYEEKTRDAEAGAPLKALEELRLGTARDYQPQVVEALARVPARQRGGATGLPPVV